MTTTLEQIKERIEKLEINPAYKAYAGYYNMALSDIQAILPEIIREVVDEIYREGMDYEDLLASLKSEPNNV